MAEINTGLGWAANSDWLVRSAGTTIVNLLSVSGATRIPSTAGSAADIISNGVYVGRQYDQNWDRYIDRYVGCADGLEAVVFWTTPASGATLLSVGGLSPNAAIYTAGVEVGSGDIWGPTELPTPSSPNRGAYYATQYPISGVLYSYPSGISVYSDQDTGWASVSTTATPFTKTNEGYAVAALAKWKTGSAVITTPVLISSVSEYTDMEAPASTSYNLAKLNILRNGIRYYMSYFDIADNPGLSSLVPVFDKTGEDDNPLSLQQVFAYIADLDHAAILELNSPDPYEEEAGASGEEGGDGEDQDDDPVEEETLPVPSVAGHGFCTIYVPSAQELSQMASYLWSGAFDVDQVIKLFSNPMDSILGLSAVPVPLSGTPEQIYLGGVALPNITMPKYTGRTSVKVDLGTATIENRWGSYLDYDPYTEFSIYLPFIGIKPLKADDIMGKTISLMYNIDILSGGCVAYIRPAGGSVLYEWSGQCGLQIPVTSRNYDNVFQTAMSVVGAVGAAVVAPASAPVLSGAVASAAVQAAATKPRIERSGTVNGITGFLGQLRPYLIRTIPEAYIPADQNKFIGYPAYINVDLANVRGYNEVDSIHLENVTATGAELDEIETILKGGVIF